MISLFYDLPVPFSIKSSKHPSFFTKPFTPTLSHRGRGDLFGRAVQLRIPSPFGGGQRWGDAFSCKMGEVG